MNLKSLVSTQSEGRILKLEIRSQNETLILCTDVVTIQRNFKTRKTQLLAIQYIPCITYLSLGSQILFFEGKI